MVLFKRFNTHERQVSLTGLDSSAPIGPVLVSPKVLKDPHNLEMKSIHNGSVVQETNTKLDLMLLA